MPENMEIIPSLELPELSSRLGDLDTIQSNVEAIERQIRAVPAINSREDYEKMASLVTELKSHDKLGTSTMAPLKVVVNRVRDFLLTREKRLSNKIEELRGLANGKMGEWTRKERLAAEAEQRRINEEVRKKAEADAAAKLKQEQEEAKERKKTAIADIQKRLKSGEITKRVAAKLLKEINATQEADLLRAEAEAEEIKNNPQTIKVETNIPKVSGIVRRKNYKAQVIDVDAFIKEFVRRYAKGDLSLRKYVQIDEQAVSAFARETKDSKKVAETLPFVKAWEEDTF